MCQDSTVFIQSLFHHNMHYSEYILHCCPHILSFLFNTAKRDLDGPDSKQTNLAELIKPLSCFTEPCKDKYQDDNANQQQPTTPSRLQHQNPSWQGRVAYVIYGGIGNESGVYYNWCVVP